MRARILVTTSRHPNPRLRSFVKDLARALPGASHVNRGKMNIDELAAEAYRRGSDTVVIVCRGQHGNPGRIVFMKVYEDEFEFYPLIIQLRGVKLVREMPDARPVRVESEVVGYFEGGEAEALALALGEALGLPTIKASSIDDLRGVSQAVLLVEHVGKPDLSFVLKFLSLRKLDLVGPLMRIRRVAYRCPSPA